MNKPVIGIVAPRTTNEERPFQNFTRFTSNFPKRIIEAGGTPIGMLFPNGTFEEDEARLCDGFLLQGGPTLESAQINTIHYALEKNKPILGICLGMQTMAAYEWLSSEFGDILTRSQIEEFFKPSHEEYFLETTKGHNEADPFYEKDIDKSKHGILLSKTSRLSKIYGSTFIEEPSLHNYIVKDRTFINPKYFKVVGRSNDGVIEAIESQDDDRWMIGVQFHPELEENNKKLFKSFINATRKHK